jgi:hypothetical protein
MTHPSQAHREVRSRKAQSQHHRTVRTTMTTRTKTKKKKTKTKKTKTRTKRKRTTTDRTGDQTKTRKTHRAAGSRKVVAALSAATTAGLMFAMATAKPAWTSQDTIAALPDVPDPVVAAPASRSQILLPVPPASDGSLVTPTVAPAIPRPVQLEPVSAPAHVVTKTVVVTRGGGSASATSSASAPAATSESTTTKSSGSR